MVWAQARWESSDTRRRDVILKLTVEVAAVDAVQREALQPRTTDYLTSQKPSNFLPHLCKLKISDSCSQMHRKSNNG